jgi:hypothetical protein
VDALVLSAGLRVVGRGVLLHHVVADEFGLEAVAGVAAFAVAFAAAAGEAAGEDQQ